MMKQIITGVITATLLATSLPVFAEHREGRHFEGREIHRFAERDFEIWRGGHWVHRRHEGRFGWWWVAGGLWYFYPARIEGPYPDPYTPSVTIITQQPPVMVAPQTTAPAPAEPVAQFWYYCDSAKGYYPYVPNCPEGWKSVPAQPPQAVPH